MQFSTVLMPYLTEDKDASHLEFNNAFGSALTPFLEAAKSAGHDIRIYSGYRSPERQGQLFEEAVKKYGSEAAARKWVAPPGKSRHNFGGAADLRYGSDEARKWAHENAPQFGLNFRMSYEPWHIELNSDDTPAKTASALNAAASEAVGYDPDAPNVQVSNAMNQDPSAPLAGASGQQKKIDSSVTDAANDVQRREAARVAQEFIFAMTPQQRMMENQLYLKAQLEQGEPRGFDEWFTDTRLASYAQEYMNGDQTFVNQLSGPQQVLMQQLTTNAPQAQSFTHYLMGV